MIQLLKTAGPQAVVPTDRFVGSRRTFLYWREFMYHVRLWNRSLLPCLAWFFISEILLGFFVLLTSVFAFAGGECLAGEENRREAFEYSDLALLFSKPEAVELTRKALDDRDRVDPGEAIALLRKAVTLEPDAPYAYFIQAMTLEADKGSPYPLIAFLDGVIASDPNDFFARRLRSIYISQASLEEQPKLQRVMLDDLFLVYAAPLAPKPTAIVPRPARGRKEDAGTIGMTLERHVQEEYNQLMREPRFLMNMLTSCMALDEKARKNLWTELERMFSITRGQGSGQSWPEFVLEWFAETGSHLSLEKRGQLILFLQDAGVRPEDVALKKNKVGAYVDTGNELFAWSVALPETSRNSFQERAFAMYRAAVSPRMVSEILDGGGRDVVNLEAALAAMDTLETVFASKADFWTTRTGLVAMHSRGNKKNLDIPMSYVNKALSLEPQNAFAWYMKGFLHFLYGSFIPRNNQLFNPEIVAALDMVSKYAKDELEVAGGAAKIMLRMLTSCLGCDARKELLVLDQLSSQWLSHAPADAEARSCIVYTRASLAVLEETPEGLAEKVRHCLDFGEKGEFSLLTHESRRAMAQALARYAAQTQDQDARKALLAHGLVYNSGNPEVLSAGKLFEGYKEEVRSWMETLRNLAAESTVGPEEAQALLAEVIRLGREEFRTGFPVDKRGKDAKARAHFVLASALHDTAFSLRGEKWRSEAPALLAEAVEHFDANLAFEQQTGRVCTLYTLGDTLLELGTLKGGEERELLHAQMFDAYAEAVRITDADKNWKDPIAFIKLGNGQYIVARYWLESEARAEAARVLLRNAATVLEKGYTMHSEYCDCGNGAYILAKVYLLQGDEEQAKHRLEIALKNAKNHTPESVRNDAAFASVKEKEWFVELLNKAKDDR